MALLNSLKLTPYVPKEINQYRLARGIHFPPRRINEIVHVRRFIIADTALRLGQSFDMSLQFWLGFQMDCDLDVAQD